MATSNAADFMTAAPPGISWTAPDKGRPWLNPPQYTALLDVGAFYMATMSQDEAINNMVDALETGVPIAIIAQSLMMNSVSSGIHTLDAGVLVMPVIMELLMSVAMAHKIDVVMYSDDYDKKASISDRVARLAVEKAMNKFEEKIAEEKEAPKAGGLMARKQKEVM